MWFQIKHIPLHSKTNKMELNTKEEIKDMVEKNFETMLVDVYQANNVETGDIAPEQKIKWDELVENTSVLLHELYEYNRGED